jgi:hypothetical protein
MDQMSSMDEHPPITKLPIEMDMIGWEYIEDAPKTGILHGYEHARPGIVYPMMWWGPTDSWKRMRLDDEGTRFFVVLDGWQPEPDMWMPIQRPRYTGGIIGGETIEAKPGDTVMVKVGGVEYPTIITETGTQRFIENRDHPLVVKCGQVFDRATNSMVDDMNGMVLRYHRGEFTQREYAEFNMAIGYSVSGFCELSNFQDMDIENPLW